MSDIIPNNENDLQKLFSNTNKEKLNLKNINISSSPQLLKHSNTEIIDYKQENNNNIKPHFNKVNTIYLSKQTFGTEDNENNYNNNDSQIIPKITITKDNIAENNENLNVLVLKKIDLKQHGDIKELIRKKFSDVNEFLIPDNHIVIGNKFAFRQCEIKDLKNKKPYQVIGDLNVIDPKRAQLISQSTIRLKSMNFPKGAINNLADNFIKKKGLDERALKSPLTVNNKSLKGTHASSPNNAEHINHMNMEYISDNKINEIYQAKKDKITSIVQLDKELFENIDDDCGGTVKNILLQQENILNKKELSELRSNNLAKFLTRKTNVKENQLLMNKSGSYRLKNELKATLDESSEKNTRYGFINDWILSLRTHPSCRKMDYSNNTTDSSFPNMSQNNNFSKFSTGHNIKNNNFSEIGTNKFNKTSSTGFSVYSQYSTSSYFESKKDEKFCFINYHNYQNNDMWVTIKESKKANNPTNLTSTLPFCAEQVRKPGSNPIKTLNNFTKCFSIDKQLKHLNVKKENLNKIENLKVKYFYLKIYYLKIDTRNRLTKIRNRIDQKFAR